MSRVAVISDSCCSLPDGFYEKYSIGLVPYYVHLGTQQYRDLVGISRVKFLDAMRQGIVPKSANPGPADYMEQMHAAAQYTQDMVVVCMTSDGSGAYDAALLARDMVLKENPGLHVVVFDTRNVNMAHGWMTLEAARAALAGATLDEILALLQRMVPVARMLQTADTLRYLYLGGRIGRAKHLFGTLLNIKPIITMEDGVIVALGQERSRNGTYRRMVEIIAEKVGRGGQIKAAIVHAADEEAARQLRDMIDKNFSCVELLTTDLSSALATHTGPGTVGVCYFPTSVLTAGGA